MKRIETIKKQNDFSNIIKNGTYEKNHFFIIYTLPNNATNIMKGIAISKKVGNAVTRNKLKRQVRAIIDKNRNLFKNGFNYIIMIRKSCADSSYTVLENALVTLLRKER